MPLPLPRRMRLAAVVPVLAACAVACGAGPIDPDEERARHIVALADDLEANTAGALDDDAAICVATALVDDVGIDRFAEIVDAADRIDPDEDDPVRDQIIDVFAACDAMDAVAGT